MRTENDDLFQTLIGARREAAGTAKTYSSAGIVWGGFVVLAGQNVGWDVHRRHHVWSDVDVTMFVLFWLVGAVYVWGVLTELRTPKVEPTDKPDSESA